MGVEFTGFLRCRGWEILVWLENPILSMILQKRGWFSWFWGFFRFGGFSRGKKVEISGFRRQKSGFFGSKTGFSGFGAKKLMGTRVLAKTHFFSSEIDSRFSYFSTFSKSQLRFGARSFGARSLLYSRTCVYALIKW